MSSDEPANAAKMIGTGGLPPEGGASWPWLSEQPRPLPPTLPSGRPWPRISIVTPSYNQGRYIEEAILSVANQGYPNVEHIVMDGGSDDGTVPILERHRSRLAYWESQPDDGQSHAINKGFARATGQILTWLNSDDRLAPGALAAVAMAHDLSDADLFAGLCDLFDENGVFVSHMPACASAPLALSDFLDEVFLREGWSFYQPEVMFTRELWERAGGSVDQDLHYVMDYDLWLRFAAAGARLQVIGRPTAQFRFHKLQKTGQIPRDEKVATQHASEVAAVRSRYAGIQSLPTQFQHRGEGERRASLTVDCTDDHGRRDKTTPRWHAMETLALAGHEVRLQGQSTATHTNGPDLVLADEQAEPLAQRTAPLVLTRGIDLELIIGTGPNARGLKAPAGFSTDTFRPRQKDELRRQLGLPVSGKIVAVAALPPAPHLAALLQSFGQSDVTVLLIGSPKRWRRGMRNVVATGPIDTDAKRADWLAAADVYAATADSGAAVQTAIEAALCGVPSVAYRSPDLERAIIDGVSGTLVAPGDHAGFQQATLRLLSDYGYRHSLSIWGRIAMETSRSYAASYHALHRAFLNAGLLQVWRDRVWIRFDPAISTMQSAPTAVAASGAYSPRIVGGRMMLRPTPDQREGLQNGRIFLALRKIARILFPRQRPEWIRRMGTLIQG